MIFQARAQDAEILAPLFDRYRQFYKQPSDLGLAYEFIKARLEGQESVIFYAKQGSEVQGFVQLYPSFSSVSAQKLWILNDLFVHPSVRRQAIGRQLLQAAQDFAKTTRARGLTLKTAHDNLPAQALYREMGWTRDEMFWTYNYKILKD